MTAGFAAAGAALVCACGMGMDGHGSGRDLQAYAALSQQVGTAASVYATAASATVDPSGCHSAHAGYDAEVQPMVDRMQAMSAGMDAHMASMGYTGHADMSCGADAMASELAHHDAAACTSTMTVNHDEAARHVAAMSAWADHQHARADEMTGMMAGSGMMGSSSCRGGVDPAFAGSIMGCRRNGDGTFTLVP